MEITTLDMVREGDTIEIAVDGTDRPVKIDYHRIVRDRCEVGVRIGLVTYAWDHPADTEVFILERATV